MQRSLVLFPLWLAACASSATVSPDATAPQADAGVDAGPAAPDVAFDAAPADANAKTDAKSADTASPDSGPFAPAPHRLPPELSYGGGGVLAATRDNIDLANAGIVGGQAAATQMSLNFSRDMEREADRVGFNVLVEAGFAGSGMVSMFERMEQAYHLMDNGAFPYLRSHPLTSERIGDARTRLALEP